MKSIIPYILFAILLCPTTGHAQEYYTLQEIREQAELGWHETYIDSQGRNIRIETDIEVFGEKTAPVLKVSVPQFVLDGERFEEETTWKDGKRIEIYRNNPADYVFPIKQGEQSLIVYQSCRELIDMHEMYAKEYGTDLTMQEMVEHLGGILLKLGISAECYFYNQPIDFSVRCKVKKDTFELIEPGMFLAHFWQEMYGFPILAHISSAFEKSDWPYYTPQAVMTMRGLNEYSIVLDMVKEEEKLVDDIPLCSFEKIQSAIESKIIQGHIRKVFDVRLGYVMFNDPECPEDIESVYDATYYLVPMWTVGCIYLDKPKKEYVVREKQDDELYVNEKNSIEYRTLFINAQTGELIDYYDKSKIGHGNADYQGFIEWETIK